MKKMKNGDFRRTAAMYILAVVVALVFRLGSLLFWASSDWPLNWFCYADMATLVMHHIQQVKTKVTYNHYTSTQET